MHHIETLARAMCEAARIDPDELMRQQTETGPVGPAFHHWEAYAPMATAVWCWLDRFTRPLAH